MSAASKVFEAATKQAMRLFKGGNITPKSIADAADKVMKAAARAVKKGR